MFVEFQCIVVLSFTTCRRSDRVILLYYLFFCRVLCLHFVIICLFFIKLTKYYNRYQFFSRRFYIIITRFYKFRYTLSSTTYLTSVSKRNHSKDNAQALTYISRALVNRRVCFLFVGTLSLV